MIILILRIYLINRLPLKKEYKELPRDIMTIEFVDVSYKYPGSEHVILDHINLMLRKNEKIGLVGLNGAGKTTFSVIDVRFASADRRSNTTKRC